MAELLIWIALPAQIHDQCRILSPGTLHHPHHARSATGQSGRLRQHQCRGPRVTGVTQALRDPDPWRAQERLHLIAQGWAGGTRIGESIAQFNREYAARTVHSRTAVIIMSDGYDTGEPERLSDALAQLRRRARRIVWLNPLCNQPGYAPVSQGMQAALPHLDMLAPGADLASIRAVLPELIEALR